jgi:hypothetical protein
LFILKALVYLLLQNKFPPYRRLAKLKIPGNNDSFAALICFSVSDSCNFDDRDVGNSRSISPGGTVTFLLLSGLVRIRLRGAGKQEKEKEEDS